VGLPIFDQLDTMLAVVKHEVIVKPNGRQFQMFGFDLGLLLDIFNSLGAQF
jgi:hypothetical protein